MTDHLPECPWPEKPCGPDHEPMHDRQPLFCIACLTECDCERIKRVEQRMWQQPLLVVSRRAGWNDAIIAAREAVLKNHRPVPVIECACWWGKDCPECGSQSNRIVGYACDACCNSSGDHAYCDDMHYDDDTPLHHRDGRWNGPHCPALAAIDALREKP